MPINKQTSVKTAHSPDVEEVKIKTFQYIPWYNNAVEQEIEFRQKYTTEIKVEEWFVFELVAVSFSFYPRDAVLPANFPCPTLDLQLMGDHLCG